MEPIQADQPKHAILSPSGADRWMVCPGSVQLSQGIPDSKNIYSTEGTDLHEVAALCLEEGRAAKDLIGLSMLSGALMTEEQADAVQAYVDAVYTYRGAIHGLLLVEQKVPLTWLTGEAEAEGTADCVIFGQEGNEEEVVVIDAKFGRGVAVEVEGNRQIQMYALGVIQQNDFWDLVKRVRLVIVQPRVSTPKEWVVSLEELKAFSRDVRDAAARVATDADLLVPSEKGCRFCRAQALCPALRDSAESAMLDGFIDEPPGGVATQSDGRVVTDNTKLGELMDRLSMIEAWMKAIRAEVERRLLCGNKIPGWKLVQGKKGNRKWEEEAIVEKVLKQKLHLKNDDMYVSALMSPSQIQKVLKHRPGDWKKVEQYIVQAAGEPSVAPASDPRPEMVVSQPLEGFEDEAVQEHCEDLL